MPPSAYQADYIHARLYLERLSATNALIEQGGDRIGPALEQFTAIWDQVALSQGWAASQAETDASAAALCCAFPLAGSLLLGAWREVDERRRWLEDALHTARRLEASYLNQLGRCAADQGRYEEATGHYRQAIELARLIDYRQCEGYALGGLGFVYTAQSRHLEALDCYRQALEIAKAVSPSRIQSDAWHALGDCHLALKQPAQAENCQQKALALAEQAHDLPGQCNALTSLGDLETVREQYAQAVDKYDQALALAHALGDRRREAVLLASLGEAYRQARNYPEAARCLTEALDIATTLQDQRSRAIIGQSLALVQERLGDLERAIKLASLARRLFEEIGLKDAAYQAAKLVERLNRSRRGRPRWLGGRS